MDASVAATEFSSAVDSRDRRFWFSHRDRHAELVHGENRCDRERMYDENIHDRYILVYVTGGARHLETNWEKIVTAVSCL